MDDAQHYDEMIIVRHEERGTNAYRFGVVVRPRPQYHFYEIEGDVTEGEPRLERSCNGERIGKDSVTVAEQDRGKVGAMVRESEQYGCSKYRVSAKVKNSP